MKVTLHFIIALVGLFILCPLLLFIAIKIKLDSKGPILYFQERIGYRGGAFIIYKFRSMYEDAENNGPMLSYYNDPRVTKWGRVMRKWKLDELPQLINVLKGEMSLVGPRPERKYYINQIAQIYPYFDYLHQVRPGLTSLGMIRFGYARNVEEIIQRLDYEISYIKNYSPLLDIYIIFYTFRFISEGKTYRSSVNIS
ncbi:MAG: sugar transferase [Chitinophagaceae bacterium]